MKNRIVPISIFLVVTAVLAAFPRIAPANPRLRGHFVRVLPGTDVPLYQVHLFKDGSIYVCGAEGTFTASTDGGKTWKETDVTDDSVFHVMSFEDESTGVIAGRNHGKNVLYTTSNGGKSFHKGTVDVPFRITGFAFLTSEKGWLVSGSEDEGDGAWRVTDDGGRTFHEVKGKDYAIPARPLMDICRAGATTLVAAGSSVQVGYVGKAAKALLYKKRKGAVLRSEDGGKTWVVQDAGNPFGTMLRGVSFFDEKHGWVVGDDGFAAETKDGGKTWTRVKTKTKEKLLAVDAVDEDTAFLVGEHGTALGTNDGGETMVTLTTKTDEDLMGCSFVSSMKGYVVSKGGKLLKFVRDW